MVENEIVKTVKAIIKNKVITVLIFLLPLFLSRLDYSGLQVFMLTFGVFSIVVALFMFYTNYKISNNWIKVFGKVVDVRWHDEILNSGQTVQFGQEMIFYKSKSLKEYTVLNDISNTKPQKKGHKIKIFYNPENEKEILVYDMFHMYGKFFFLILFGVIMIYYTLKTSV